MLYEGQSYSDTNTISGTVAQGLTDLFLRYPLHLNKLIETQQKQYDTDGYNHLYVAKNLDIEKIQTEFNANSIIMKQRQMIGDTNYTKEIYNAYQPIQQQFHGLLTPFVNVDRINNSYEKQTEFVELYDITENGTDFMKQDLKGLYCSIPQEIDLQLSSPDIRSNTEFLEIYETKSDDTYIEYANTYKLGTDCCCNAGGRKHVFCGLVN
eukprot:395963_1